MIHSTQTMKCIYIIYMCATTDVITLIFIGQQIGSLLGSINSVVSRKGHQDTKIKERT